MNKLPIMKSKGPWKKGKKQKKVSDKEYTEMIDRDKERQKQKQNERSLERQEELSNYYKGGE